MILISQKLTATSPLCPNTERKTSFMKLGSFQIWIPEMRFQKVLQPVDSRNKISDGSAALDIHVLAYVRTTANRINTCDILECH